MTTVLPNGELQSNPRIAYNKGYQQGKADREKEDNEFFNFDKVIEIEKNKSYKQGAREFAEWLYTSHINIDSNTIDMQIWVDHWLRKYENDRKNDGSFEQALKDSEKDKSTIIIDEFIKERNHIL